MPPLLTSFEPEALAGAQDSAPQLPRGLLLETLWPGWLERAQALARLPASSMRVTKRLLKQGQQQAIAQQMQAEGEEFRAMLGSPEAREAFSAFLEKRKPDFSRFG